jgi:hypothetical protein
LGFAGRLDSLKISASAYVHPIRLQDSQNALEKWAESEEAVRQMPPPVRYAGTHLQAVFHALFHPDFPHLEGRILIDLQ